MGQFFSQWDVFTRIFADGRFANMLRWRRGLDYTVARNPFVQVVYFEDDRAHLCEYDSIRSIRHRGEACAFLSVFGFTYYRLADAPVEMLLVSLLFVC